MAIALTTRMSPMQLCGGAIVGGAGLALAFGVSTSTLAAGTAAVGVTAGVAALSRRCMKAVRGHWKHKEEMEILRAWLTRGLKLLVDHNHLLTQDNFDAMQSGGNAEAMVRGLDLLASRDRDLMTQDHFNVLAASGAKAQEVAQELIKAPLEGNVIHFGNLHWRDGVQDNSARFEHIWASQVRVAENLLLHPDATVFDEALVTNCDSSDLPFIPLAASARELFPMGIPKEGEVWNQDQKRFLARHGAAATLFFLGKIKSLHRWTDRESYETNWRQIQDEFAKGSSPDSPYLSALIRGCREIMLIKEMRAFMNNPENKGRKVIILFGARHDFSKYFKPGSLTHLNLS